MGYTPKKYDFAPPREPGQSIYKTEERQIRHKLQTIESMLARTRDPEARAGLERRRADLRKELAKYDKPKEERARKLWRSIAEKHEAREKREER